MIYGTTYNTVAKCLIYNGFFIIMVYYGQKNYTTSILHQLFYPKNLRRGGISCRISTYIQLIGDTMYTNRAKFTYRIQLSRALDATATGLTWETVKDPAVREEIFKVQREAFDRAEALLAGRAPETVEAATFNDAVGIAGVDIAAILRCAPSEVLRIHRISVYADCVVDERVRRILRSRSLRRRSGDGDWRGMALPYMEALWWRTDFDTHYMNIADMLYGKTRREFLAAFEY